MEQHAVPRQITTFEFKLIGFLTIKQFGSLVFFGLIAVFLYFAVPIPIVNIASAIVSFLIGAFIVFVPINDRPVDIWITNFFRRLISPSQYFYHKINSPPDFLKNVFIYPSPDLIASHVDAQKKLASYLNTTGKAVGKDVKKQQIQNIISSSKANPSIAKNPPTPDTKNNEEQQKPVSQSAPTLSGVVRNSKNLGLPNILVYIRDKTGRLVRILKTNHNGVFASFHSLPEGNYSFEIKDLGQKYFFDTMNFDLGKNAQKPLSFYSKELL
ncbi:hypothetical protein A3C23_04205 [Candidatus Roizmanbacteria bacterium RIFCSPHIGHO2_02_FULL_37_13b]|uniref:PrgI family protein n=1 Tax=Candidatus Roizmanbacteria bacterium RIFCSPLOWO2_02_FULL_36_11 TaxID=1802071 RepID=A0A1F7JH28_9BACT|nr:MAG: hypothetical protein A3C23_04205 [Candidatus Roizmanbacteria bacterium RIFCSPHIGHO2_02_FULL_37_13b]OGK54915.1 MAG: hypothetical protein A3H78_00350 [Candidatus Roizmanbacteria bacterium RIFCSPLOWO2_02_FULL_36_11]